jgi:serine protease Do
MRTWMLIAAGLMVASAGATAAMLPGHAEAQADKKSEKATPPADRDDDGSKGVRRRIEVFGGRDVQIGVTIRNLEGDQARAMTGALVTEVREDSPAAKAGIKTNDVVVEFDGEKVRSARHLSRLVSETAAGHSARIAVQRDGKRVDLQVTPEAGMAFFEGPHWEGQMPMREFEFRMPDSIDEGAMGGLLERHGFPGNENFDVLVTPQGRGRLGIGIQGLTPQLAEYFGTKDGVLVTSVEADSPAAKAGLKAGDVITAVGDTPVSEPSDLTRAVRGAGDGAELSIAYTRDRKSATTKAKLEPRERPKVRKGGEPI